MKHSELFVGNTAIVVVDGLADLDDEAQNDATVTLQSLVAKESGEAVTGVTVPLSLAYVAGSQGEYRGVIPHDAEIDPGTVYEATIRAVASSGVRAEWVETLVARRRAA